MKKSIKYVSVSTMIVALIGVTIFGMSADAAGGVKTTYGRRLQEQSPESLDSSYAGWSWVDTDSNDYFGNVGQQAFVITKGGKYRNITVDVEPKEIKPTIKVGSSVSTIPSLWAGNSSKARISSYQHKVTVTAGTGGSVSGSGTYTQGDTYTIKATASSGYKFVKWSDGSTSASRTLTMGTSNVSYNAMFESTNTMLVTDSLPAKVGDVSIMTVIQAYIALANSNTNNTTDYRFDPSYGYNTSKYYMYGITGEDGVNSTATNLQAVGLNWYKQLNKPTTQGQIFTSNGKTIFGGPFQCVFDDISSHCSFHWYYDANSVADYSYRPGYWNYRIYATSQVYVAIVCAR